ncbi:BREX system ATP-binding domain-containing protein [Archangium sp.]|uniref:BREX system ATP-binding domain-containing protein n=1 Tax=Archangium sp. TaxID=1872627 RepID=UPI00389A2D84
MNERVSASDARRIVRALRYGATPSEFADRIFVGQAKWLEQAVIMSCHTAEDGDFEVRFVRAAYGGGKTLFLKRLEQDVTERNWVTAYVLLKHGSVDLDKFETVAAELCRQLVLPKGGRGLLALLEIALQEIGKTCGYEQSRSSSFATHERVIERVNEICLRKGIGYDMTLALRGACRSFLSKNSMQIKLGARWLAGGPDKLLIPGMHVGDRSPDVALKPLGVGAADQLLRLIAVLVREAGYAGLLIAIDELELISGLPPKRRANAFQTLRGLVDQNDSQLLPPSTCLFLAATPQMFEDREMFPSYKALQDRIESLPVLGARKQINYRAPVIDLDATELQSSELYELGERIIGFYELGGESVPTDARERLKELVNAVTSRRYVIARPRLLCRCVVEMLEGSLGQDLSQELAARNEEMLRNRQKEVLGS